MAYCTNCGQQLQHGVKFCPNCGTPAGGPSVPESFDAPPAQAYRSKASVPGILLIIFGAILSIVGAILWISGTNTNNNMDRQMESFFNDGRTNPGDTNITVGIVLFVVGLVLLAIGVVLQILCFTHKNTVQQPNPAETASIVKKQENQKALSFLSHVLGIIASILSLILIVHITTSDVIRLDIVLCCSIFAVICGIIAAIL